MALKLTIDEDDLLGELLAGDGYKILLRAAEAIKSDIDKEVLTYDLSKGSEGLMIKKAQSEGADKMLRGLISLRANLKKAKEDRAKRS